MEKSDFGRRIKKLRIDSGLSMQDLADKVGVTKSSINMWENSNSVPKDNILIILSKIFNVSIDYLLGNEKMEEKVPENKTLHYIQRNLEKLDEQKVTNVAYVWHSYAAYNTRSIDQWYPGDEYVDWCAISYFAKPQWFPMVQFAKAHNKPLMIAECSPALGTNASEVEKITWYRILFKFIESQDVKALCYINGNWDEQPMFEQYAWGNGKLDISENIKNYWLENISNERFINLDRLYKEIK